MNEVITRLKSKVVWLAVIAQVCLIITLFMPEMSDLIKTIAVAVVEILTLFGVLNNPADAKKF